MSISLEDLLDGTMDQLADAPSYEIFPAGIHLVEVSLSLEKFGKAPKQYLGVKCELTYKGTVELVNPETPAPKEGSKNTVSWMLQHEKEIVVQLGQGALKKFAAVTNARFGESRLNRTVIEDTKNLEMVVTTKIRKSVDGAGNDRENLEIVEWALPD